MAQKEWVVAQSIGVRFAQRVADVSDTTIDQNSYLVAHEVG